VLVQGVKYKWHCFIVVDYPISEILYNVGTLKLVYITIRAVLKICCMPFTDLEFRRDVKIVGEKMFVHKTCIV